LEGSLQDLARINYHATGWHQFPKDLACTDEDDFSIAWRLKLVLTFSSCQGQVFASETWLEHGSFGGNHDYFKRNKD